MSRLKKLPDKINCIKVVKDLGMSSHLKTPKRIAIFKCDCGNEFKAKVNAVKSGQKNHVGVKIENEI